MNCSTPGLPVHHHLPEFTQTHIHQVGDAIQPSHPLSSPSPPTLNLSQHQGLFKIGKAVHQGCILSPCLFNLYAEYIMRNAGLEETQAGIKIAGKNINNPQAGPRPEPSLFLRADPEVAGLGGPQLPSLASSTQSPSITSQEQSHFIRAFPSASWETALHIHYYHSRVPRQPPENRAVSGAPQLAYQLDSGVAEF